MHPLIGHEWLYGVTECLHILGFAVAIGGNALVDLHLLGWGFSKGTAGDVARQIGPWTTAGITLAVLTGLVILSTDPGRYLGHPVMQAKFVTLGFVIIFNSWVHDPIARAAPSRGSAISVACISLLLWTSIVFGGIFYAFT